MKQPRSTSHTNTRFGKKTLLPSFRQPKAQSKVQQVSANGKAEIFIHSKLIPVEITADRKTGETMKITLNSHEFVVNDSGRVYRANFSPPSNSDVNSARQWIQLGLGDTYTNIKIRKIGDENSIGAVSSMVYWDRAETGEKKIAASVNLKDVIRSSQKTIETSASVTLNPKEDKSKQMKAFVANLMSKKVSKRASETNQPQQRLSMKKRSEIFRSKLLEHEDELNKNSALIKFNPPSTAGSILSGISGVRSFRRDILEKNNLKESKFTGKSEKQTSIGDHSLFMNHKLNVNTTHLSSLENEEYDKKKQKFDSQPYFYQKSTITSTFSNNPNNQTGQRFGNLSRQDQSASQIKKKSVDKKQKPEQKAEDLGQTLNNKSQHCSQQEVEEDIKRSAMLQSSLKQSDEQLKKKNKVKNEEQSSECFESKELQSSGTIYQSKYQ